jgi:hypothetical protein
VAERITGDRTFLVKIASKRILTAENFGRQLMVVKGVLHANAIRELFDVGSECEALFKWIVLNLFAFWYGSGWV